MKKIFNIKSVLFVLSLFSAQTIVAGDEISPMSVKGATTVTTEQAKKLFDDGALFLDVRKDKDWNAGRVSDALQLNIKTNFSEESLSAEMGKGDPVVIYCNGERCLRSSNAAIKAVSWGFTHVYYYRDGFPAWKNAGYPVE